MLSRVRLAWHVLRGRPCVSNVPFNVGIPLHSSARNVRIEGCTIYATNGGADALD